MQTVWSPNNGPALVNPIWLVVHTAQGATTDESLASYIANANNQVSYHYLFDDDSETQTVGEDRQSWSALGANAFGIHFCTTGFAAWSRDQWLQHSRMLDLLAARMKEVGGRYGIDGEHLNDDQIRNHVKGSIGHGDYARATRDGDHTDPGPNFPWDYVQARMGYGAPPSPPPAPRAPEDDMAAVPQDQWNELLSRMRSIHFGRFLPVAGGPGGDLTWFQQQIEGSQWVKDARWSLNVLHQENAALRGQVQAMTEIIRATVSGGQLTADQVTAIVDKAFTDNVVKVDVSIATPVKNPAPVA